MLSIIKTRNTKHKLAFLFFLHSFLSLKTNATNYYVNDGATTGDIYCSAIGANSAGKGLSSTNPARTLRWLFTTYSSTFTNGDTIFIDAGTYGRGGADATTDDSKFDITTAGLTFKGAGIGKTIFDNNSYGTNTDYFMEISANDTRLLDFTVQEYEGGAPNSGTTVSGVNTGGQAITINGAQNIILKNIQTSNNGGNGNAALTVSPNSSVFIEGGGSTCNAYGGMYSGGIDVFGTNITLTIKNTIIAYNSKSSGYYGGGLYVFDGSNTTTNINLDNVRISGNTAVEGGGVYINGGNVTIRNSILSGNVNTSTGVYGGAICIIKGILKVAKCSLSNNSASKGAAIGVNPSSGNITLTVDSCYFSGNTASSSGPDIYARPNSVNEYTIQCNYTTFSTSNPSLVENDNSTNTCVGSDFSISNCGNPITLSTNGGGGSSCGINKLNTTSPGYTPSPNPPNFSGTCGSLVILPIELTDFYISCTGEFSKINWTTASEKNNEFFYIQRSSDAIHFTTIKTINGAGNSNSSLNYEIVDEETYTGIAYYRLAQKDFDGTFSYSKIIWLNDPCKKESEETILIFPNPNNGIFEISIIGDQDEKINISIRNELGQIVKTESYTNISTTIKLRMEELKNGVYFIELNFDGKKRSNHKIIKL